MLKLIFINLIYIKILLIEKSYTLFITNTKGISIIIVEDNNIIRNKIVVI